MRSLSDALLLTIWEAARRKGPLACALTVLQAAEPEATQVELAALSLGQRDNRLLEVYALTFGSALHGFAECPACRAPLEVDVDVPQVLVSPEPAEIHLDQTMTSGEHWLRFRLLTSHDLAVAATAPDEVQARRVLVRQCVLEVRRNGQPETGVNLPETVLADLACQLAKRDPQADLRLAMSCPACSHSWEVIFDAAEYLWTEISARARRLLREVDRLARVYAWSEAQILSMSAARREAYLELVS
jgi:hypothetical protein